MFLWKFSSSDIKRYQTFKNSLHFRNYLTIVGMCILLLSLMHRLLFSHTYQTHKKHMKCINFVKKQQLQHWNQIKRRSFIIRTISTIHSTFLRNGLGQLCIHICCKSGCNRIIFHHILSMCDYLHNLFCAAQ